MEKAKRLSRPWHAHYDPGVKPNLGYPDLTLPQLFDRAAEQHPDRVATLLQGKKQTYRQLAEQIDRFAAGLRRAGIKPGDRVAVMLPNIPQFVVAFYGSLKAGAVVVPTNPLYTQHELEFQLNDSGAIAIVTLDQLFEGVQAALPSTSVRTVIAVDVGSALPRHLRMLYRLRQRRQGVKRAKRGGMIYRFEDLLHAGAIDSESKHDPDEVAVLQYTGGTTGQPRAAMLTHRNLVANAFQAYEWQSEFRGEQIRVLCAAPFFHVYGQTVGMNQSVVAGATMILLPRFIPKQVAKAIKKYKPQLFPAVPTMFVALSALKGLGGNHHVRVCLSGAAPLPSEVQTRFQDLTEARVVEGYGLTEASPITHCNPAFGDCRPGTVGVPMSDTDAKITDPETWEELPSGTVGEMTISGPQIMKGYWNRPEETAAVLRDGWLHTGDLATMDEEGYFRIVDRKKDLILASGYNVYPREVEDVLYQHPQVKEAAVIGVASDYRGETVKAFVVLKDGARTTEEEIILFCRGELAAYKVPKIVEFTQDLPKSLIGKVLRRKLREDEPSRQVMANQEGDQETLERPVA